MARSIDESERSGEGRRPAPVSVAILAGGRSSRMGTDKAMLRLHPAGPTFLELAVRAAAAMSDDVFVIASDRPEYSPFGAPVRADRFPDAGALGGIATALVEARYDVAMVVSCDHPFLNPALLSRLALIEPSTDVLIPRLRGMSRQGGAFVLQTLHAAYRRRCLPFIETALKAGNRQIVGFFNDVTVSHLDEEELRAIDPDLRSLTSVNTPESLESVRQVWRSDHA